jgi:hypothetical protein
MNAERNAFDNDGVPIIVKSVPLRSVGMIVERGNNEWLEKLQFTQSGFVKMIFNV